MRDESGREVPAGPLLGREFMEKAAMDIPPQLLGGKLSDPDLRLKCIQDDTEPSQDPGEIVVRDYEGVFTLALFPYDDGKRALAYLQEQDGIGTDVDHPIGVYEYRYGAGTFTACADPLAEVGLLTGDEILDHDFALRGGDMADLTAESVLFHRGYVEGMVDGKAVNVEWDGEKFVRSRRYVVGTGGLVGYGLGQEPPEVSRTYELTHGEDETQLSSSWDYSRRPAAPGKVSFMMWDNGEGRVFCIDILEEGLSYDEHLSVGSSVGAALDGMYAYPFYNFMYVYPGEEVVANYGSDEVLVGFDKSAVRGDLPPMDNDLGVPLGDVELSEEAKVKYIRILCTGLLLPD